MTLFFFFQEFIVFGTKWNFDITVYKQICSKTKTWLKKEFISKKRRRKVMRALKLRFRSSAASWGQIIMWSQKRRRWKWENFFIGWPAVLFSVYSQLKMHQLRQRWAVPRHHPSWKYKQIEQQSLGRKFNFFQSLKPFWLDLTSFWFKS